MFYTIWMPHPSSNASRNALSLKVGRWLHADASGWGVAVLPLLLLMLLAAGALGLSVR